MKPTLLAGLALFGLLATDAAAVMGGPKPKTKFDTQINLVRPAGSPDADAKGTLRVRSDTKKARERFDVHAKKVDPALAHDLYVEDGVGAGTFTFIAAMEVDGGDDVKYSVDTKKGDSLPFDVAANTDLVGRIVEVRVGADVVLSAAVPPYAASKKALRAKVKLDLAAGSPDDDATGKMKLKSRPFKGDERFQVSAKRLDFSASAYHVWMEDGPSSGVFADVGELAQKGSSSKGRLRLRTKDGQDLPFGVPYATDLEGRAVEVRDDADAVILEGVVPVLK